MQTKEQRRLVQAAYYQKNKEALREKARVSSNNSRTQKRAYLDEYLATHPCVDCGISDIRVLEFDHVRGVKVAHVSEMLGWNKSLDQIIEEVAKCDVRCANCHRIITRERRKYK